MVRNITSQTLLTVSVADIAERAYQLYLKRGRVDGFDREDWRSAERELKAPARYLTTWDCRDAPDTMK